MQRVNVIGAGLSGLSAACTLAKAGITCNLISSQPSERAQSVLAEGGINAAVDTMGEGDSPAEHYADTMRGGCELQSEEEVRLLTSNAPDIVIGLQKMGVPLMQEEGRLILRNFGGQKKKRTAYAKASTGKMIMTGMIDTVRRYEAEGLVVRYPHHELIGLETKGGAFARALVKDLYTGRVSAFSGSTILCSGGLNGFFEGLTTGTQLNTGNAAALAFRAGVEFANLEFIQYHPTTAGISGKRMLISEAARGEGGRLCVMRRGEPWYFMEEKYPELGNLMPRDVVSREMYLVEREEGVEKGVFLDMTHLPEEVWEKKLSDLREEILSYMHLDAKKEMIPVSPGIHYFMGGIRVNASHRTNIRGLYAAGEAAARYHGANRLGGNSMLGALFGGKCAAEGVIRDGLSEDSVSDGLSDPGDHTCDDILSDPGGLTDADILSDPEERAALRDTLYGALGIIRNPEDMEEAERTVLTRLSSSALNEIDRKRAFLGLAMVRSALARRESRGAHMRTDYPVRDEAFRKQTVAVYKDGDVRIRFEDAM